MKLSTVKNIAVKCGPPNKPFWTDEIQVDAAIFDDPLLEACTRAVEKRKDEPDFKLTIIIEAYEKKNVKNPDLHFCYNTYIVMINAGLYEKAEMLRLNFKKMHGNDLKNESIRGEIEEDGKPDDTKPGPNIDSGNSDKSFLN